MLLWNALKVSSQIIKVQLATNITILINTHIVNKICAEIIFFPKYIMKYYPVALGNPVAEVPLRFDQTTT